MKAIFSINMYSGLQNPEVELTEEQSQKVIELANRLDHPITDDNFSGLRSSVTNYMVWWGPSSAPFHVIHVSEYLDVQICRQGDVEYSTFQDTVGLWAYLAPIGGKIYLEHRRQTEKAMEDYHEEMFGIPK